MALIELRNVSRAFGKRGERVLAVDSVSFAIDQGEVRCLVGESGCGKSITARSILQIVDKPGRIVEGSIRYHRRRDGGSEEVVDLAKLDPYGPEMRGIRGKEISMARRSAAVRPDTFLCRRRGVVMI